MLDTNTSCSKHRLNTEIFTKVTELGCDIPLSRRRIFLNFGLFLIFIVGLYSCKDDDSRPLCQDDILLLPVASKLALTEENHSSLIFKRTIGGMQDTVTYIRETPIHDFAVFEMCDTAHRRYQRISYRFVAEDVSHHFALELVHDGLTKLYVFSNRHATSDKYLLDGFTDSFKNGDQTFYDCSNLEDIHQYDANRGYSEGVYDAYGNLTIREMLGEMDAKYNFEFGLIQLRDNIGTQNELILDRIIP